MMSGKNELEIKELIEELKDHLLEVEKSGRSIDDIIDLTPEQYMDSLKKEMKTDYKHLIKLLPIYFLGVIAYFLMVPAISGEFELNIIQVVGFPIIAAFGLMIYVYFLQQAGRKQLDPSSIILGMPVGDSMSLNRQSSRENSIILQLYYKGYRSNYYRGDLGMKRVFGLIGFLILFSGFFHVVGAEQPVKEGFDFTNPEFVATVEMLNMEGHSNDNIANCNVKQLYYDEVGEMFFTKGMSKNEILDYYVNEQGIQALNSPPASGFNLSLWITPFLLISLAIILVSFIIYRWKKNHSTAPTVEGLNPTGVEEDLYVSIIEEERKKYI